MRAVPYRANRAVLFDSSLLHQTDPDFAFLPGYDNHRINLTLLFGNTDEACARESAGSEKVQPVSVALSDAGFSRVRVAVGATGGPAEAATEAPAQRGPATGSRVQWG